MATIRLKLAPDKPNKVAAHLAELTGNGIVVIDANDLGVEVLGRSSDAIDINFCKQVFKDNPLDQGDQQTPIAIVRKVTSEEAEEIRSGKRRRLKMQQSLSSAEMKSRGLPTKMI